MHSYPLLDIVFVAGAGLIAAIIRLKLPRPLRPLLIALVILLIMTAVFDNLMIAAGLFSYNAARITGWHLGRAPLEDFAYPLVAGLLMPAVWTRLHRSTRHKAKEDSRGV